MVDNNSTDGSQVAVENYYLEKGKKNSKIRFFKLKNNIGFAGAMNWANGVRNPEAKYLALTHNDLVPKPNYINKLVTFLEKHPEAGAVQGIVTKLNDETTIDSAGFMLNEILTTSSRFAGKKVTDFHKSSFVSFVEGTMPMYNLEALKQVSKSKQELFVTEGFMYYLEDVFLSLRLWSSGFKCMVLPLTVGSHYRMGSSKKANKKRLFHYLFRNRVALLYITNSEGKLWFFTQTIRKLIVSNRTVAERKAIMLSLIEGIKLGRKLRRKYGYVNLYSAPLIRESMRIRLHQWLH
jgi:GT2 family glycosyltransferase